VLICLERGANDLYMVQLMSLPPHHLFIKFQIGLTFLVLLTQVVLNGCLTVVHCVCSQEQNMRARPSIPVRLMSTHFGPSSNSAFTPVQSYFGQLSF